MKIKNLGLICAKANSTGLKNKNLRKIKNKSLFEITCNHIKKSKLINDIIVSTDSKKISAIAKKQKINVPFVRPKYLCLSQSPEWHVWRHALKYFKNLHGYFPEALIVCPCTSPKRNPQIIDIAIKKFYQKKSDVLISITKSNSNPEFNLVTISNDKLKLLKAPIKKIFNRQETLPTYKITTNVYVLKPEFIMKYNHLFDTKKVDYVLVDKKNSLDIDDYYDYKIAKLL